MRVRSLGILAGGVVLGLALLSTTALAAPSPAAADPLEERARQDFEEQLYRDCLETLEQWEREHGALPSDLEVLRARATLRQELLDKDSARSLRSLRPLVDLLDRQPMEEATARAVVDLVGLRQAGTERARVDDLLGRAQRFWESHHDPARVVRDYEELFEAALRHGVHGRQPLDMESMWSNLVAAGLPRDRILRLAEVAVLGEVVDESTRWTRPARGWVDPLLEGMGAEVLRGTAPVWLRAQAHLVLAERARVRGDRRAQLRQLRALLEEVPDADRRAAAMVAEARRVVEGLVRPRLGLEGPDRYRPGSQHLIKVSWANLRSWDLTVEKLRVLEDLQEPERQESAARPADFLRLETFYREAEGTVLLRRHFDDQVEVEARRAETRDQPHVQRERSLWLDPLPVGLYRMRVKAAVFEGEAPEPVDRIVVVTPLGVSVERIGDRQSGDSAMDLWVVDMETGRSVKGAKVRLFLPRSTPAGASSGLRRFEVLRRDGETDAWGRLRFSTRERSGSYGQLIVGEAGGRPFAGIAHAGAGLDTGPSSRDVGWVWTDRPLYKPGETVHIQAILRRMHDDRRTIEVPQGRSVRLRVLDARGQTIEDRELVLDANGTCDTTIPLDPESSLGVYQLRVRSAGGSPVVAGSFRVEEFRLPEFRVGVEVEAGSRPVLGDSLRVVIGAEYLFGGGVAGRGELVVRRQPRWRYWAFASPWSWAAKESSIRPPWGRGAATEVYRQAFGLDLQGRAVVLVPTSAGVDGGDWEYRFEARVIDESRREERGEARLPLSTQALRAYLRTDHPLVGPRDRARFRLHVEDGSGRGTRTDGQWVLRRQGERGLEVVGADSVRTGEDGDATIEVRIDRVGAYRLSYEVEDGRGNLVEASTDLWCADPRTHYIEHRGEGLQLIAESEVVTGDRLRLLVVRDVAGGDLRLTRSFAGGAEAEVLRMRGTVQWVDLPVGDRQRPAFEVRAVAARDYQWSEATLKIVAPQVDRSLDLELSFADSTARPGETTTLRVVARDASGLPTQTVFGVSVVDQAVLEVVPRNLPSVETTFLRFLPATLPARWVIQRGQGWHSYLSSQDREAFGGDHGEMETEMAGGGDLGFRARGEGQVQGVQFKTADSVGMLASTPAPEEGGLQLATLREDWRSTALWTVGVRTDERGVATVEVPLSSSLTTWKALAVAVDGDSRVGTGEASVRARLPVMVRLQSPRGLREGDRVTLGAIAHNETDSAIEAEVELRTSLVTLPRRRVRIEARSQARVEWEIEVPTGVARLEMKRDSRGRVVDLQPASQRLEVEVRSAAGSDAMARDLPLLARGTPLRIVANAVLRPDPRAEIVDEPRPTAQARLEFRLPTERAVAADLALVHVTPSVLGGCLQALPYLAEFPYGCTEQTLSRFVPALAVRAAGRSLHLDMDSVDPDLDQKVRRGMHRIRSLQHADGSWSWWESGPANLEMTAYAVRSLAIAGELGSESDGSMLDRGTEALRQLLASADAQGRRIAADTRAYALAAIARAEAVRSPNGSWAPRGAEGRWLERLFEDRDRLSPAARALTAMALATAGHRDRATDLLRHLGNDRQQAEDGSLYWRDASEGWRSFGPAETTAFVLEALEELSPDSPWTEPVARWLLLNREGHRWKSTRETAHVILALAPFAARQGQGNALRSTLVFRQQGREIARLELSPEKVLRGELSLALPNSALQDGLNRIDVELVGAGPVWVSLEANLFSRQQTIDAGGSGLRLERELRRLRPVRTLGGWYESVEEKIDDEPIPSGGRIRVRLRLHATHDLDFVWVRDPRPAGFEAVDRLSGPHSGGTLRARREVGSWQTEFFIDSLPAGDHVLDYELIAERPGTYRAEPARVEGMYLPTRAAHSSSRILQIGG